MNTDALQFHVKIRESLMVTGVPHMVVGSTVVNWIGESHLMNLTCVAGRGSWVSKRKWKNSTGDRSDPKN